MKTVNKREFVRQFSKYLKDCGVFCLTVKDVDEYVVTIEKCVFRPPSLGELVKDSAVYFGCGCKKKDSLDRLCSKHGRS